MVLYGYILQSLEELYFDICPFALGPTKSALDFLRPNIDADSYLFHSSYYLSLYQSSISCLSVCLSIYLSLFCQRLLFFMKLRHYMGTNLTWPGCIKKVNLRFRDIMCLRWDLVHFLKYTASIKHYCTQS